MPQPIRLNSRLVWDRLQLDDAFAALSDTARDGNDPWSQGGRLMLRAAGMKLAIVYAFLCKDRDRHGNVRYYFRRDGKKTRIRARPGTLEFQKFQTEYDAFLDHRNA
jgi:hypothetical protein